MASTLTPAGAAPPPSFDALTRARLVIEHSSLACVVTRGRTHEVRFANRAACEALGGRLPSEAERPLHEHFRAPADVKQLLDHVATTLAARALAGVDYVHPEAGVRRCTLTVAPVVDEQMRFCGLFSQLLLERPAAETPELIHELKAANERLLLAGLREQQLADEARERETLMKSLFARESLLAQASAALGATLNYHDTVQQIARLTVPKLAEYCVVHAFERGKIGEVACAHHDFKQEQLLQESSAKRRDLLAYGVGSVVSSGMPVRYSSLESRAWLAGALGFASSEVFDELGARALLCLPLKARGVVLGVMSVVRTESSPPFSEDDLRLFMELALRSGVALDNAILYRDAQSALQQRDDLLAIVSHDLRSPLGAIALSASALLDSAERASAEETQRPLRLIRRAADHMLGMIGELLDLASIHAQKLLLDCARTDLGQLIGEVLEILQPSAALKQLRLERRLPAAAAHGWCDAQRIMRTLTNLVGNAIKFTPPGGRVLVELIERGDELEILVSDTGIRYTIPIFRKHSEPAMLIGCAVYHLRQHAVSAVGF